MAALDLAALRAAPLSVEPFQHLILPGFVRPDACAAVHRDFPRIDRCGSFPVDVLTYGPAFAGLLAELNGPAMRAAFEEKFAIDLGGRPTIITVRGRCSERDGSIHTDSESKIITVLIYMNGRWESPGGRLRLLRSADDLDDVVAEVPPEEGTLVAFRRSRNSFHGHKPFAGERRVIQFNWVTDPRFVRREILRHRLSARLKSLVPSPRDAASARANGRA